MIQRKQTLFLLLSFILVIACFFLQAITIVDSILLLSAALSVVAIFFYKHRKRQGLLCVFNMLTLVLWYLMLAVNIQNTESAVALEWPALLPTVSIILLFLARQGILADEKLVRSLDRIR